MNRFLNFPSPFALRRLNLITFILCIAFMVWFQLDATPMRPLTIIDYEFAFTAANAQRMFAVWQPQNAFETVRRSLWVDFLFMPTYALCFAGVALTVARRLAGRMQTLGLWLLIAPFIAAVCDVIENIALLNLLPPNAPTDGVAFVAGLCASIKFSLLLLVLGYVLIGWLSGLMRPKTSSYAN